MSHTGTHPLNKARLGGHLEVPQIQISTFWPCSQSGGMGGMPLQTGDPAVKGAGGTVEMIRGQRANKRLLKTLKEMTDFSSKISSSNSTSTVMTIMLHSYLLSWLNVGICKWQGGEINIYERLALNSSFKKIYICNIRNRVVNLCTNPLLVSSVNAGSAPVYSGK